MIHIRIQQRNGRKTLTSVQGLSEEYDLNHGLKYTCKTLLQKKDGNQVVPLDSGFISVRALYDASFEKSRVYFIKEKLSKCVSVTLLVTVLLSNILNMVKLSSFKVFAFI